MAQKYFKDLIVWQKSMDLVVMVYQNVKILPKEELYALSDQIRRSAVSIPSNIAEGQQSNSPNEFIHFLSIAKGSLGELETQLLLCEKLGYIETDQINSLMNLINEVGRLLNGLLNSLMK